MILPPRFRENCLEKSCEDVEKFFMNERFLNRYFVCLEALNQKYIK
jgi:hypothetical protein